MDESNRKHQTIYTYGNLYIYSGTSEPAQTNSACPQKERDDEW